MSFKQIIKVSLLLSVFILSVNQTLAQKTTSLHVGVSEGLYSYRSSVKSVYSMFLKSGIHLGTQIELKSSRLNTYGIYQLFGNFKSKEMSSFLFSSHLLGVGLEHRMNNDKDVSLIIGFSALTEVKSNFRNGYITDGIPVYPSFNHSDDFYHSTPFASSLWIGVDVQIVQGLSISFSVENNFRILKKRHLNWELSDFDERPIEDVINEQTIETVIFDKVGLRLGLSYNFSFNKGGTD